MKKCELSELLHSLNIPVNEGVASDKNANVYPRIVYWDYIWEDVCASGDEYEVKATYQISFYSLRSKHEKLVELRKRLREMEMHPVIYHEFVEEDRVFHSYFALEVIE